MKQSQVLKKTINEYIILNVDNTLCSYYGQKLLKLVEYNFITGKFTNINEFYSLLKQFTKEKRSQSQCKFINSLMNDIVNYDFDLIRPRLSTYQSIEIDKEMDETKLGQFIHQLYLDDLEIYKKELKRLIDEQHNAGKCSCSQYFK